MQIIYLDISNKGVVPTVYAKQGDVGRKFEVVLTDFGIPYYPPNGSAFSVWYSGSSGEGNYTDIDDRSAFSVNENKVAVEMISQMLTNDGNGVLCLVLNESNGNQIGSWNIPYICEKIPGFDSEEAKSYYTAFAKAVESLPYTDASLSIPGKSADAAATGLALAGKAPAVESADYPGCYYRTVNGAVEWLNPPMVLGVEYRTTERYDGHPVYIKRVDCGEMPNAKTKRVDYADVRSRAISIDYGGIYNRTPIGKGHPYLESWFTEANVICMRASDDKSAITGCWAIVKYVKS